MADYCPGVDANTEFVAEIFRRHRAGSMGMNLGSYDEGLAPEVDALLILDRALNVVKLLRKTELLQTNASD